MSLIRVSLALLFVLISLNKAESVPSTDCFIQNLKYKGYLTGNNLLMGSVFYVNEVYTTKPKTIRQLNKASWSLLPVEENKNETFYLKSNEYNDYLCALNDFEDL
jgi:hypothetical protein